MDLDELAKLLVEGLSESHSLSVDEYETRDFLRNIPRGGSVQSTCKPALAWFKAHNSGTIGGETHLQVAARSAGSPLALALRFNPYHDELGRFSVAAEAVAMAGAEKMVHGVPVVPMNAEPKTTVGPAQEKDLDPYRNEQLKSQRPGDLPFGQILRKGGRYIVEAASERAARAIALLEETTGLTMDLMINNYEKLFKESDPLQADWYHKRFTETGEYATETGYRQTQVAAVLAVTSPRMTWEKVMVSDGKQGSKGTTIYPNWDNAKAIIQMVKNDAPMKYKGAMVRPSDKDADGNFIIPAEKLFGKGGHPDRPMQMMPTFGSKAVKILRGEMSEDDALGSAGSSAKTRSFYNNIISPWSSETSTIDGLMAQALQPPRMPKDKHGRPSPEEAISGPYRHSMADGAVRYIAKKYGLKPHEVQARIWTRWQSIMPKEKRAQATRASKAISVISKKSKATGKTK